MSPTGYMRKPSQFETLAVDQLRVVSGGALIKGPKNPFFPKSVLEAGPENRRHALNHLTDGRAWAEHIVELVEDMIPPKTLKRVQYAAKQGMLHFDRVEKRLAIESGKAIPTE